MGGSRHLLINHYKNLIRSYTTWRNCINNSYSSAIKVVGFWSKDTALEWHNRETVSLFLNNFSTTFNCDLKQYLAYINVDLKMTANVYNQHKKSPICGETCSDLTQPCYQAFLSLNVNIEIILDWVKICPELRKVVKVFKNDHSLWTVNSLLQ